MLKLLWMTLMGLMASCASIQPEEDNELVIVDASRPQRPAVAAESATDTSNYTFEKQTFQVEWVACKRKDAKGTILQINRDETGFNAASYCTGWIAQAGLLEGYDVIGVNRPGFGRSNGVREFGGRQSVAAIQAANAAASKSKLKVAPAFAIWGVGSGSIAAAFSSKALSGIYFLVIGNGIFDTEEAMSGKLNSSLASELRDTIGREGEEGHEYRSMSWDTSKLPKNIVIYHTKDDTLVPPKRAEAFRDSLATAGYKVELQVIEGADRSIDPNYHAQIMEVIFRSLK